MRGRMSEHRAQIAVVDYGMGNLRSATKALEHVEAGVTLTADPDRIRAADGIVLPGVGAFPEAMRRIRDLGLEAPIRDAVETGTPLLGICLGMQLLFDSSVENGGARGLGLLPGEVTALEAGALKVPHIGWEPVRIERESPLAAGIETGEPFYFVHSFVARPRPEHLIASAVHGERFAAVVGDGHVFGTQFHPEKSSAAGLRMLGNFVSIASPAPVA
jgi:glutamine amidotransferase